MTKLMESFKTNQCDIYVYDTNLNFNDNKIYCILSIHRATGKINTRFGNEIQTKGIIKSYRKDFENFHLQNI